MISRTHQLILNCEFLHMRGLLDPERNGSIGRLCDLTKVNQAVRNSEVERACIYTVVVNCSLRWRLSTPGNKIQMGKDWRCASYPRETQLGRNNLRF
jgi:hypothetical protein